MYKYALIGVLAASLVAGAGAQTRSSFLDVDLFKDLFVNVSNDGLSYEVIVGANPQMIYQNTAYDITDVFGFWALSNDEDLVAIQHDLEIWKVNQSNSGLGGIAGWKTSPNTGLTPGQSYTFTFDSLSTEKVDQLGFHIRIDGTFPGTEGNTGYATAGIPEPGLLAPALLGLLPFARRFRKNP